MRLSSTFVPTQSLIIIYLHDVYARKHSRPPCDAAMFWRSKQGTQRGRHARLEISGGGDKYHRKSVGRKGADMYEHSLSQTRRRNSFLQMSPSHGALGNSIILHSVQLSNIWPRAPLAACMRFAFRCRKVWNHVHFDTIVRRVSWALYCSIVEQDSKTAGLICNPFV